MKIVTDCAADMPNEELEKLGVVQAPLFIQFPEGEVSSADISADDFYNRLEAMRPQIPTTAQPSGGIFAELYRKLALTEKNILSIHISLGLSGTINAARDGGNQVTGEANISHWDTLTLSGGERFQVLAAALACQAGWALNIIQERLTKIREKTEGGDLYAGYPGISRTRRSHWTGESHRGRIAQAQTRDPRGLGRQVQHSDNRPHPGQIHDSDCRLPGREIWKYTLVGNGIAWPLR